MDNKTFAEAFPPGDYILEELEARGWTQLDLAAILDRPANVVNEIIKGIRPISIEIAKALGHAFGTSAEIWLNLQNAYRLANTSSGDNSIIKRAALFEKAPIREMIRRGWLEDTKNIDVLETQVCQFYDISNINDDIYFAHAARKSDYSTLSSSQLAWLIRARNIAKNISLISKYEERNFDIAIENLRLLISDERSIMDIPKILMDYGIRFIIIEQLPHTKIDGACFWLDEFSPVIALSLRYDRIDGFWFTLFHELAHIKDAFKENNPVIETRIYGLDAEPFDNKSVEEKKADEFAANVLVDQNQLSDFVNRFHPVYSKLKIAAFAKRVGVHPGIVVGQLQFRGKIPYANLRATLVKVKELIIPYAITDGWGNIIPI